MAMANDHMGRDREAIGPRFEPIELLGEGASARVWRARDAFSAREVALKLALAPDPAATIALRLELETLRQLRHPRVVEALDGGATADGRGYLVLALVPGPGLDAPGALAGRAEALFADALEGLAHVHARGYLHGDLKPENMRLDAEGRLVLVDFGLMRRAGEPAPAIQGTPLYVAPEVVLGERQDARTDLYALAATFYHLLAGRPPFAEDDPLVLARAQLYRTPTALATLAPGTPPALADAITRMLAKAPAERPASAHAVLEGLGRRMAPDGLEPTGFLGREAELAAIRTALEGAAAVAVALTGAPGAGKSVVLEELQARLRLAGREVVSARAGARGSEPYGALAELRGTLATMARLQAPDAALPAEADLAGAAGLLEPAAASARARAAWTALIARACPEAGLVVLLDDWDRADEASRDLMAFLVERRGSRVSAVAAGRHAPWPARGSRATPVALEALAAAQTAAMVDRALGGPAPAGLAEALRRAAAAVPGTMVAALAELVRAGALRWEAGTWHLDEAQLAPEALARAAGGWVERAIAGLSPDEARLAAVLASLRRPRPAVALGAWLGLGPEALGAAAAHLVAAALAAGGPAGMLAASPAVAAAMTEALGPEAMAAAHGAIATGLASDAPTAHADLAWHAVRAGRTDQALVHVLAGARALLAEGALADAGELAAFALERATDAIARGDAHELLGDLARRRGDDAAAVTAYERALAERPREAPRARATTSLALVEHVRRRVAVALQLALAAAEAAAREGDAAEGARALTTVARLRKHGGDVAGALAAAETALERARAAHHRGLEAEALGLMGVFQAERGDDPAAALATLERSLALREELGDPLQLNDGLMLAGNAAMARGHFAKATACFARNVALSADIGAPPEDEATASANLAQARLEAGDLPGARLAATDALTLARVHGLAFLEPYALALRARAAAAGGQAGEALEDAAAARAAAHDQGRYMAAAVHLAVASAALVAGDVGTALEEALAGLAAAHDGGAAEFAPALEAAAGEAWLQLGAPASAGRASERLQALAAGGSLATSALAHALAAGVALARGEAAAALEAALQGREEASVAGMAALRVELDLLAGRAHLEVGRGREALRCFERAGTEARRLGLAPRELEAARAIVRAAPGDDARAHMVVASAWLDQAAARMPASRRAAFQAHWSPPPEAEGLPAAVATLTVAEALRRLAAPAPAPTDDSLAVVAEFGRMVTGTLGYEQVLDRVIDQTMAITGADRGMVILVDALGGMAGLVVRSADGARPELVEFSHTFVRAALDDRKPVWVADARGDERFAAAASVVSLELRSVLCVPLIVEGEPIGVIYVDCRSVNRRFGATDLALVEGLAGFAGLAIANARTYEAARGQAELAAAVVSLGGLVGADAGREEVERAVLTHALRLGQAGGAALVAGDPPRAVRVAGELGAAADMAIAAGVLRTGQPYLGDGGDGEPHACLVVPLRAGHVVVGALYLVRAFDAPPFAPADLPAVEAIAAQAGAAWHALERTERREARILALEKAVQLHEDRATESNLDGLTRLFGFPYLRGRLALEVAEARRYQHPLTLLALDVGGMTEVNARFGQDTGDAVLCQVARELQQLGRSTDVPARVGGDEFVVLMPHTSSDGASQFRDRLRARLADIALADEDGREVWSVAARLAVVALEARDGAEEVLDRALAALARAGEA